MSFEYNEHDDLAAQFRSAGVAIPQNRLRITSPGRMEPAGWISWIGSGRGLRAPAMWVALFSLTPPRCILEASKKFWPTL